MHILYLFVNQKLSNSLRLAFVHLFKCMFGCWLYAVYMCVVVCQVLSDEPSTEVWMCAIM